MILDFKKIFNGSENAPCMKLLSNYMRGKLSGPDFNKELAYIALESINKLCYLPEPVKPKKLFDFDMLRNTPDWKDSDKEDKAKMYKKVGGLDEVVSYREQCDKVLAENSGNLHWLRIYKDWIPEQDAKNRRKVLDAIKSHEMWIRPRGEASDKKSPARPVQAPELRETYR